MTERSKCIAECIAMVSLRPEIDSDSIYDVIDTPRGVSFFTFFRFFSFIYYAFKTCICSTEKTNWLQRETAFVAV